MPKRIIAEKEVYIKLMDLLGIFWNNSHDNQGTAVIVIRIEIDSARFVTWFLANKLGKIA